MSCLTNMYLRSRSSTMECQPPIRRRWWTADLFLGINSSRWWQGGHASDYLRSSTTLRQFVSIADGYSNRRFCGGHRLCRRSIKLEQARSVASIDAPVAAAAAPASAAAAAAAHQLLKSRLESMALLQPLLPYRHRFCSHCRCQVTAIESSSSAAASNITAAAHVSAPAAAAAAPAPAPVAAAAPAAPLLLSLAAVVAPCCWCPLLSMLPSRSLRGGLGAEGPRMLVGPRGPTSHRLVQFNLAVLNLSGRD